jgi:NADPH2:quinone reductase
MTQAIRIKAVGGPEVMAWEDVQLGSPAAGEVHVRHSAVGVNYIDIYHRTGAYPVVRNNSITRRQTPANIRDAVHPGLRRLERHTTLRDDVAKMTPGGLSP